MKSFFLSVLLMLVVTGSVYAQNKYEYASIAYSPTGKKVLSVTDDKGYHEVEVSKWEVANGDRDMSPAFKQIKKMEEEGWELFDTQTPRSSVGPDIYYFFLRKKRS